jgi:hypothetical protein
MRTKRGLKSAQVMRAATGVVSGARRGLFARFPWIANKCEQTQHKANLKVWQERWK